MKKQLFVFFLSCNVAVAFAQTEEAKVLGRAEALNKAIFQSKDSLAILDLVSTGVTYGHSSGVLEDKPTMLHNAVANKTTYNNFSVEPISIGFINKKTAIVRHILRANTVDEKGAESPLNLGVLQVWAKEGRKWRIVARQAVKVPEKK